MDLNELFSQEESAALERSKKEMVAEEAAWNAMPPEEQARVSAEKIAKYEAMFSDSEEVEHDEDEEGDEEEDD